MNKLDAKVANIDDSQVGEPQITGAYASLINSDLHDDFAAITMQAQMRAQSVSNRPGGQSIALAQAMHRSRLQGLAEPSAPVGATSHKQSISVTQ